MKSVKSDVSGHPKYITHCYKAASFFRVILLITVGDFWVRSWKPVEADFAGSVRAEPAESASTDSWGLTQKSPTVISRMDPYLPASENPVQKYRKP